MGSPIFKLGHLKMIKPNLNIRPSVIEDCQLLASCLRPYDVTVFESGGQTANVGLECGYMASSECWTVEESGNVVAIFGVVCSEKDKDITAGLIWMAASPQAETAWMTVTGGRLSKEWLSRLEQRYNRLYNFTDATNAKVIRWLRWMGFNLIKLHPRYGCGHISVG